MDGQCTIYTQLTGNQIQPNSLLYGAAQQIIENRNINMENNKKKSLIKKFYVDLPKISPATAFTK